MSEGLGTSLIGLHSFYLLHTFTESDHQYELRHNIMDEPNENHSNVISTATEYILKEQNMKVLYKFNIYKTIFLCLCK